MNSLFVFSILYVLEEVCTIGVLKFPPTSL